MSWPVSAKLTAAILCCALATSIALNVNSHSAQNSTGFNLGGEDMLALVRAYFPQEFTNPALPDDEALAFVVDESKRPLEHAVTRIASNESVTATIAHTFPDRAQAKPSASGSACFPPKLGEHGKFCVLWTLASN